MFSFQIKKSKRKTIALSVVANQQILVKAPFGFSTQKIHELVYKHRVWLQKQLAKKAKEQKFLDSIKEIQDSYELPIFGVPGIILKSNLKVVCQQFLSQEIDNLFDRYSTLTQDLNLEPYKIGIFKSKWGSCHLQTQKRLSLLGISKTNKFQLKFNLALVCLPKNLIKYVFIHELCHTRFMNHSANFWQEVEKLLPNYKELRKEVKKYSPYLVFFTKLKNVSSN